MKPSPESMERAREIARDFRRELGGAGADDLAYNIAQALDAAERRGMERAAGIVDGRRNAWNDVATRMCEIEGFTAADVNLRSILGNEARCCARAIRTAATPLDTPKPAASGEE